jgi:hypothetical protein
MKNKSNDKNNSRNKAFVNKNIIYIFITVVIIAGLFGANKILSTRNTSLPAILFRSATTSNRSTENITEAGLDYYMEKYGQDVDPSLVEAKRVDLGCHFEIHIFEEGKLIMRLGYAGKIYEL